MRLEITNDLCAVTKRVFKDFNSMSNSEFFGKYSCTKSTYYKRVQKYGDPYMKSPYVKIGKWLYKVLYK